MIFKFFFDEYQQKESNSTCNLNTTRHCITCISLLFFLFLFLFFFFLPHWSCPSHPLLLLLLRAPHLSLFGGPAAPSFPPSRPADPKLVPPDVGWPRPAGAGGFFFSHRKAEPWHPMATLLAQAPRSRDGLILICLRWIIHISCGERRVFPCRGEFGSSEYWAAISSKQ